MLASRARFRARLDTDNRRWVLFLLAAASISELGFRLTVSLTLEGWTAVLPFLLLPFFSLFFVALVLLHSRLMRRIGVRLGGAASLRDLHAVYAWAGAPLAACAPLVLTLLVLRTLPAALGPDAAIPSLGKVQFIVRMTLVAAGICAFARSLVYLSEAQRFSKLRALANQAIAAVIWLSIAAALFKLGNIPL